MQLEADETSLVAGYKEVSFGELIVEYENYKAKSNRPFFPLLQNVRRRYLLVH